MRACVSPRGEEIIIVVVVIVIRRLECVRSIRPFFTISFDGTCCVSCNVGPNF